MIITKAQIQAIVDTLPASIEFPENWPTPDNAHGQWARVMSAFVNNPPNGNPSVLYSMERAIEAPGFAPQHQPDWAVGGDLATLSADPETAPWALLNALSSYVLPAYLYGRRVGMAPTVTSKVAGV